MARITPAVLSLLLGLATPALRADVPFTDEASGASFSLFSNSYYSYGGSITIVSVPPIETAPLTSGATSFVTATTAPVLPAVITPVVYPKGNYFGLLTLPNGTGSAIGSIHITFGAHGRGTGVVRIGNNAPCALQIGPGGSFSGGPISVPILIFRPGDPDMQIGLTLVPPSNVGDPPTITGTMSDDGNTFPVTAISTKPADAGALKGKYTFELTDPSSTDFTDLTVGGVGSAIVSAKGSVHAYLVLADGSILTPTGTINSAGTFDFIAHSRKKTLVSASLTFGPTTTGTAHWESPEIERHDKVVSAEASTDFTVSGAAYDPSLHWGSPNWHLHLNIPDGTVNGNPLIAEEEVNLTVAPHNANVLRSPTGITQMRLWQPYGIVLGEFRDLTARKLTRVLAGVEIQSSPRATVTGFASRPGTSPAVLSAEELLPGDVTVAGGTSTIVSNPIQGGLTSTIVKTGNGSLTLTGLNPVTIPPPPFLNFPLSGTITNAGGISATLAGSTLTLRTNPITVPPINVATGGATITINPGGSGSLTTTLNPVIITTPVVFPTIAATITTTAGAGSLTFTKAGGGSLTLTSPNTYTGSVNVNGGTLQLSSGTLTGSSNIGIANIGTATGILTINPGTVLTTFPVNTVDGSTLTLRGSTISLTGGTTTILTATGITIGSSLPPGSLILNPAGGSTVTVVTTPTTDPGTTTP